MIGSVPLLLVLALGAPPLAASRPQTTPETARATTYYHYILGSMAEAANDLDEACLEYQRALDADPSNTDVRTARARALMQANRMEEMKREIDQVLSSDSANPQANELLGMYYYSQKDSGVGNLARALDALRRAADGGATNSRLYYLLGQLYLEEDSDDPDHRAKALAAFEKFTAAEPEDFDGHYRKALVLELLGRDAEAERSLLRALEIAPVFTPAYRELMAMYARTNRVEELRNLYVKVLAAHPDDARTRAGLAATFFEKELYAEALDVLDYEKRAGSYGPPVRTLAARIYGRLNRPSKVIEVLKGLEAEQDPPLDGLFELGRAYEARGDFASAAAVFELIVKKSDAPTRAALLFHLGFTRQQLKDHARAEEAYAEGIQAATTAADRDMEVTLRRYMVLNRAEAGNAAGARTALDEAKHAFPDAPELRTIDVELSWAAGSKKEAIETMKRLVAANADDWDLKVDLARRNFELKHFKDIVPLLRRATESEKSPEEALYLLGAAYERSGDIKKAREVLELGLRRFPRSADMMNYLGYTLIDKGTDLRRAVELVTKAVDIEPENEAFLDSLAWGQFKLGDIASARKNIDQSLAHAEPNWEIMLHAGEIYCAAGSKDEAVAYFEKAIQLSPADAGRIRKRLSDCRKR